ncbi:MAG: TATA-box-binding protein [Nanoarchaeota archaeon]|nr:TATA-box-binding protein [Nanoarchaeota archaeon]
MAQKTKKRKTSSKKTKAKKATKKKTTKKSTKSKKPTYHIQNVVASASLHHDIPLEKVTIKLPNTEYNPEQFPGLVLRLVKGKTALIFSSGKIVCTGAKSEAEVKDTVKMIIKELKKVNIYIKKKPDITIQNMVASGDINMTLNLNKLAFKLENAEYEPEQFPGLVYKVPNSHITFLLFGTGKIVCTGAKNEKEIKDAVNKLVVTLKKINK